MLAFLFLSLLSAGPVGFVREEAPNDSNPVEELEPDVEFNDRLALQHEAAHPKVTAAPIVEDLPKENLLPDVKPLQTNYLLRRSGPLE